MAGGRGSDSMVNAKIWLSRKGCVKRKKEIQEFYLGYNDEGLRDDRNIYILQPWWPKT